MLTCVSCYYQINNKHGEKYLEWFKNTLAVNCPYVFFTDEKTLPIIKSFRGDLPTYYIIMDITEFTMNRYRDRMVTHQRHCPSVELNVIWNEKIFMLDKAANLNPFQSEWFLWVDAGICTFRDNRPSTEPSDKLSELDALPKDKIIYTSSGDFYDSSAVNVNSYYHYVSGTSYMIHRDFISFIALIYDDYFNRLANRNNIWTDQVLLTHIYKDIPSMFYKWFNGYGMIAKYLFGTADSQLKE
jgi:hypothetical protein